jgi:multidrug resistance efflux pump
VSEHPIIPVPWRLMLRRAQYQIAPIAAMLICTAIVGWLWMRNARAITTQGEVNVVRVSVESKIDGLLVEIPQPVRQFDVVRKGQVIARLDLDLVEKQVERLQSEIDSLKRTSPANPVIAEREAQIAELRARLDARDIKSPIDGTVMQIHERPGQSAKPALPIMVIAAERGDFIVGYVRENQGVRPTHGMEVTVRPRGGTTTRSLQTFVESVAPQLAPLPARYLRNPAVIEWALPVQIALPAEADLKPGEMVDLVFHPQTK